MKDAINSIEEIRNLIFDFDIKIAMNKVSKLIEDLILISSNLSQPKTNKFMSIITLMNIALGNKDYLLYSDILKYELRPFLEQEEKS
ncbi:hypothetical protein [Clostridium vincentii]|uniref:Uncharacterized protein n=1 Tax=Clostridium vincentii TaxID=52704 RepID=A0A2T0BG77_9CLOT|nr:hypothetical protein [Clostridium vincentii]PRR82843.1 hypothetical protein CLVI_14800 [Clostridium vincentii]